MRPTTRTFLMVAMLGGVAAGQGLNPAPDRRSDEGEGPFDRLAIMGVMLIDGSGAPPRGPVNLLISKNRIVSISKGPIPRPDKILDGRGLYVLPGFVDLHAHGGEGTKAPDISYCYKLWLAHGVTTIRGVPLGPHEWVEAERARSAQNEIVAPRIFNYQRPPALSSPEKAREWVREMAGKGIDGLKLGSLEPPIMAAFLHEANQLGLGSVAHLGQEGVAQMNALDAARLGLREVTHFYGHFEALLRDHRVQPWPVDHNHDNEYQRFSQVARLWDQIHPPGSEAWYEYLAAHRDLGTVFNPTFTIYSANRDVMRARRAEWHDTYTLPTLWDFFEPSHRSHGSYFFAWTSADEIAWRRFYQVWMRLVDDYRQMGGRVTCGSDPGFIYDTWGFGYVEELELLQEAGFHPLEVIRAATWDGARTITGPKGLEPDFGLVREGYLADLVLTPENPLADFKTLLATQTPRLQDSGEMTRVGRVRWTIKDGIIYDVEGLLKDVRQQVEAQKSRPR